MCGLWLRTRQCSRRLTRSDLIHVVGGDVDSEPAPHTAHASKSALRARRGSVHCVRLWLEPVLARDAVARPVVEVLVADDALHALVVGVGGRRWLGEHARRVEDEEALVLHRAHLMSQQGRERGSSEQRRVGRLEFEARRMCTLKSLTATTWSTSRSYSRPNVFSSHTIASLRLCIAQSS